MICDKCEDGGIVCENHPDHPWDGTCCGGAGQPCECCEIVPQYGQHSIGEAFIPRAKREQIEQLFKRWDPLLRRLAG